MFDCKPVSIFINPELTNFFLPLKTQADKVTIIRYQSAIGLFILHVVYTQPDVFYFVRVFCQYCADSGIIHSYLVIQIFRYLAEISDLQNTFESNSIYELIGYFDSDQAVLKNRQRLINRYFSF